MPETILLIDVGILRSLLKGMMAFRALYEAEQIDTIRSPDGREWSLWDVEYLFGVTQISLPPRQAEAIRLFLRDGMSEADTAERMGLSRTNPIGMYVTKGLGTIVSMVNQGRLARFKGD